jgi:hypothetical protein
VTLTLGGGEEDLGFELFVVAVTTGRTTFYKNKNIAFINFKNFKKLSNFFINEN